MFNKRSYVEHKSGVKKVKVSAGPNSRFQTPFVEHPKNQKGVTSMITLPISPLICSVLTTLILIVTFYFGRWCGIKTVLTYIEKEIEKND